MILLELKSAQMQHFSARSPKRVFFCPNRSFCCPKRGFNGNLATQDGHAKRPTERDFISRVAESWSRRCKECLIDRSTLTTPDQAQELNSAPD